LQTTRPGDSKKAEKNKKTPPQCGRTPVTKNGKGTSTAGHKKRYIMPRATTNENFQLQKFKQRQVVGQKKTKTKGRETGCPFRWGSKSPGKRKEKRGKKNRKVQFVHLKWNKSNKKGGGG